MVEVSEYVDAKGRSPYRDFVTVLDGRSSARVSAAVLRMELGNFGSAKSVGSGVLELRLDFGPGYRVYFGRDGEQLVVLLGGGSKQRQQAGIRMAHLHWADYKKRKREG